MSDTELSRWDLEELILYATGKNEAEVEKFINDSECIEDYVHRLLEDKHQQSYEYLLGDIVKRLLKMVFVGKSEITDDNYKGFAIEEKGHLRAICKIGANETLKL
jgi:DNA-binding phage protein